jgi:membrane-bound lytic murein transglycosylase A
MIDSTNDSGTQRMKGRRFAAAAALLLLAACCSTPQLPEPPPTQVQVPPPPPEQPLPPPTVVQPPPPPPPDVRMELTDWQRLPGWQADHPIEAWTALLSSCATNRLGAVWERVCTRARALSRSDERALRKFLETELSPWRILYYPTGLTGPREQTGLITGYYEPVLRGSRQRGGAYQTPLYGVPDDLLIIDLGDRFPALKGERLRGVVQGRRVVPYPKREQLADGTLLTGKELLWVDDPVEAFFLEVQGSGRVRLPDGSTVRLAFADVNGQPYRSIGRYLIDKGELTLAQTSMQGLKDWVRKHPERKNELLNQNPSFVFFSEEAIVNPAQGPRGALGVPLTAGRSIAVDPRWLPLGAPMYLATSQPGSDGRPGSPPLNRLVVAQDTGGAIRGGIRADVFFGSGVEPGNQAGRMRAPGQMWLLWPKGATPQTTGAVAGTTATE